jgi:hypothetical protein
MIDAGIMDAGIADAGRTGAGITGVSYREAHLLDVAAGGDVAPPRPGRWSARLRQGVLALVLALGVTIVVVLGIALFLVPLASAAGGCGGG